MKDWRKKTKEKEMWMRAGKKAKEKREKAESWKKKKKKEIWMKQRKLKKQWTKAET